MEAKVPALCTDKQTCCGCSACFSVCPVGAITMKADEEGFLYPEIDREKCIRCQQCLRVCAFKKDQEQKEQDRSQRKLPEVYAVKHQNDAERMQSQSGGLFAALSDEILKQNGVIYGCAFNDKWEAVHMRGTSAEERDRMRYSKYVQSDPKAVFQEALEDLKAGRTVLFSGTSCQIAGLKAYINCRPPEEIKGTLFTVDIVCHGVPSPLVWADYLAWESEKQHAEITEVICRNKRSYGWKSHVTTIQFLNGKTVNRRVFPKIFYGHQILRPACYKCPYKSVHHPSDITIADYWGIDKALPGFKDEKGVSLALVNTEAGADLFDRCKDALIWQGTRIEDSLQKPLIEPYDPPANRAQFWTDYKNGNFTSIAKKYGDYSMFKDMKWKVKVLIKRNMHKKS